MRQNVIDSADGTQESSGNIDHHDPAQKIKDMLVVQVKEGDNIERALKKYKRKFEKTKVLKDLRNRQAFEKPSVTNREANKKAVYVEQLKRNLSEI